MAQFTRFTKILRQYRTSGLSSIVNRHNNNHRSLSVILQMPAAVCRKLTSSAASIDALLNESMWSDRGSADGTDIGGQFFRCAYANLSGSSSGLVQTRCRICFDGRATVDRKIALDGNPQKNRTCTMNVLYSCTRATEMSVVSRISQLVP